MIEIGSHLTGMLIFMITAFSIVAIVYIVNR